MIDYRVAEISLLVTIGMLWIGIPAPASFADRQHNLSRSGDKNALLLMRKEREGKQRTWRRGLVPRIKGVGRVAVPCSPQRLLSICKRLVTWFERNSRNALVGLSFWASGFEK